MEDVLEKAKSEAKLYNKLLKEKENGKIFTKEDITEEILYELCINENVIDAQICDLFNVTRNQLRYIRKKYGMQNIFLLKILGNEYKEEAYAKIKEIDPEEDIHNFDKIFYKSIYLYGKSKGWNEEFMKKNIPNIPLDSRDFLGKEKSDTLESQDYTITVTAREHVGNKKVQSRNISGGRRINQVKVNIARVKSGKFGEKLVVKNYEENRLRKLGIKKRVIWCTETDEPDITYDGLGYDAISYNEKQEKIYIEVKTSKSNPKDVQFDISEKEVMQGKLDDIDKEHCFIYYVYNLDEEKHTASIEVIDSKTFENFKLKPIMFRVDEVFK